MTLMDYHPLYTKIPRVHIVNGEEGKPLFFFLTVEQLINIEQMMKSENHSVS